MWSEAEECLSAQSAEAQSVTVPQRTVPAVVTAAAVQRRAVTGRCAAGGECDPVIAEHVAWLTERIVAVAVVTL